MNRLPSMLLPAFLCALAAAFPAQADGPPHDPRLERVAWEMGETERSPRVLGWSVQVVGEDTLVLDQSWPEGYRLELTTEGPLSAATFFASDNASGRMAATLHHPGQGSPCRVGWGRHAGGERAQMMAMRMGEDSVAGTVSLTISCYGSDEPLGIGVTIVPAP